MTSTNDTIDLTPDEIAFTNAFNAQRTILAGFATCSSKEELHIVRDGFYLGLASALHLAEYDPVREAIVTDPSVASAVRTNESFRKTVEAARNCTGSGGSSNISGSSGSSGSTCTKWEALVAAVKLKAALVGSDLEEIWNTLENGRLEWLAAASAAHKLKTTLQTALRNQCGSGGGAGAVPMAGDVSDAKMIWMYALSLSIPSLQKECRDWQTVVQMNDVNATRPLVGYKPELWDCRKVEWEVLDRGVQAAAERGGSTIDQAWSL